MRICRIDRRLAALILVQVAVLGILSPCSAEESETLNFDCESPHQGKSEFFPGVREAAEKIDEALCDHISSSLPLESDQIAEMLEWFGVLVSRKIGQMFPASDWPAMAHQSDFFRTTLSGYPADGHDMPSFNEAKTGSASQMKRFYFFGREQRNTVMVDDTNNSECKTTTIAAVNCDVLLQDLMSAINPYQRNANAYSAYNTRVELRRFSQRWDKYLERGRYQNSVGIALTTFIEKRHFEQDWLVGPPVRQWHALQPNIVVENLSDAPDGENVIYSVAMEWIGVNWWEDSIIGVPLGISVASVYADRPEVKDTGHGVMLHVANKYTFGVADHDGDTGVYVSLDLMKLFMNRREKLESYRSRIRSIGN